jgi:hypothetical protein
MRIQGQVSVLKDYEGLSVLRVTYFAVTHYFEGISNASKS